MVAVVWRVVVAAQLSVEKLLQCVEAAFYRCETCIYPVFKGVHALFESVDSFGAAAEAHGHTDASLGA